MRKIALLVSYDGSDFSGFQYQENAPSIQGTLEKAILAIFKEPIRISSCSRTDAGVHARGHVSHFETEARIPTDKIPLALNTQLPATVTVRKAAEVSQDFHARFDPIEKCYSYSFYTGRTPVALWSRYATFVPATLDLEAMRAFIAAIVGTRDFKAFQASGSDCKGSTVRTIYQTRLSLDSRPEGDFYRFEIQGNGFLYNMVRIVVGTMIYIGQHKLRLEDVLIGIEQKDRKVLGKTMPPQGLCLEWVRYKDDLFNEAPQKQF